VTGADVVGPGRGPDRGPAVGPTVGPATVIHLITTLSQGGAERVLAQLVPRPGDLPRDQDGTPIERHVVISLVDGGMFADELRAAGVEVRGLGMRPGRDVAGGTLRLARVLRELRPAAVISWMYHASLLDLLARPFAGAGRRARMIWMLRGSLESTASLSTSTRTIIRILARRSGRPDMIVANSAAGRDQHVAHGYRPRRWGAVPNGCDLERFAPDHKGRTTIRMQLGVTDDEALVAFIGRAHAEKGLDVLLEALPHLAVADRITLLLIGAGTLEADIPTNDRVRIVPLGVRDDVERVLRGVDVLVLPSRSEGTANAVIEALATEVPCIVTDVGDSRELVGEAGITVPPESPHELAHAITRMLALTVAERRALGALGRARMMERHGLDAARTAYRTLWTVGG